MYYDLVQLQVLIYFIIPVLYKTKSNTMKIKEENTELLQRFSTYAGFMEKDQKELVRLSMELRAELDKIS